MFVFGVLLSGKLGMDINKNRELRMKKQRQIEALELIRDELQYEVDCEFDRDYVIKIARRELGLVLPHEITYYFEYSEK